MSNRLISAKEMFEGLSVGGESLEDKETTNTIIPKKPKKSLSDYAMTPEKIKELKEMRYVIDNLIPEGMHTYIFGASGAGKTTVLLHLGFEMVMRGYKVFFLYLDGELISAAKISEEITRRGIADKYKIITDGTMADYSEAFKEDIKDKTDLSGNVIILDTFKFLTADIQSKTANKNAMHFIKDVCKLGATFVSLGHTNKDGQRESGTAEIEQDCDVLLRIDSVPDSFSSVVTTTIMKGGRARATIKPRSYKFTGGDPLSVDYLDETVDVQVLRQAASDEPMIAMIGTLLRVREYSRSEIVDEIEAKTATTPKKIQRILAKYDGKKWESKRGDKNKIIYYVSGNFLELWKGLESR